MWTIPVGIQPHVDRDLLDCLRQDIVRQSPLASVRKERLTLLELSTLRPQEHIFNNVERMRTACGLGKVLEPMPFPLHVILRAPDREDHRPNIAPRDLGDIVRWGDTSC